MSEGRRWEREEMGAREISERRRWVRQMSEGDE